MRDHKNLFNFVECEMKFILQLVYLYLLTDLDSIVGAFGSIPESVDLIL